MKEAREKLFSNIKATYLKYNNRVMVEACTGAGKCKIALDLFGEDLKAGRYLDIIVPQEVNKKTWEEEIVKWHYSAYRHLINIYCYASLKHNPRHVNCIADEIHMLTDAKLPLLKTKTYLTKLVGLSATLEDKRRLLVQALGLHSINTVKYSLDDGVSEGIVVPYHITVVEVPLEAFVKTVEAGSKTNRFKTTELAGYDYLSRKVNVLKLSKKPKILQFALLQRMRYIYDLPSKLQAGHIILKHLPQDKKIIGFCGGIKQAESLFQHTYHSKTSDKDYNDFVTNKISRLGTVFAANMGININDLDIALIVQIQSKDIHLIQRVGRLLRHSDNPDKVGKIIIIIAKNTQDEVWVKKALESFDPARIDYTTISQIRHRGDRYSW